MAGLSSPRGELALPAQCLKSRLRLLDDLPDWATYLPNGLRQGLPFGRAVNTFTSCVPADIPACVQAGQVAGAYWWRGRVWALSRDPAGCRDIQRALDSDSEVERVELAAELRGHVYEAMRCPHANYVLQKALSALKPNQLSFIVDELDSRGASGIAQVARHKYGCRIVQRLLECGGHEQAERVVSSLLVHAVGNCVHPYGNYAMQKVLEHGPTHQRRDLVDLLQQHVATLGTDSYGSSVLSKALSCGSRQQQLALVRAMLAVPGLLLLMSQTRLGNTPAKIAMKLLEGAELEEAKMQLAGGMRDQLEWQLWAHVQASGVSLA